MSDEEQLNLLSIFHFVLGGLTGLCSLFPCIHLFVGLTMITSGQVGPASPDFFFAGFFVVFALAVILSGLTLAAAIVFAGLNLRDRKNYMFCMIVAGVATISFPLGTVLGIFTIIVLMRPSVRELFHVPAAKGAYPGPPTSGQV